MKKTGDATYKIFLATMFIIGAAIFVMTTTATYGQSKVDARDSITIKKKIEAFYTWYIDLTRTDRVNREFNPMFVRQSDGMTRLDYEKYRNGLIKYQFSKDFIRRKIASYKECYDNLAKIPFEQFSQFNDIDAFASINCDFTNRFEWTGGMEPTEKAVLTRLTRVDNKTIEGKVDFSLHGNPDGFAMVTLKKIKNDWKIDDLKLTNLQQP